jgi:hypothetical protein
MSDRMFSRRLCRLAVRIAPADMRDWAAAMVREIDEIEDPRTGLEWSLACLFSCIAQRLRPLLRGAATAARLAIAGYCFVVAGQMALEVAPRIVDGAAVTWRMGFWILAATLFGASAALLALKRAAAAWTATAATAITATNFLAALRSAPPLAVLSPDEIAMMSQERLTGYAIIAVMSTATAAAFWLTRRPPDDLIV